MEQSGEKRNSRASVSRVAHFRHVSVEYQSAYYAATL